MSINNLKEELKKVTLAEKELEEYLDKKIGDLPREIRQKLNNIAVIPHTTAAGLESVKPIWERLLLAQTVLREKIDKLENKIISDQKIPPTAEKKSASDINQPIAPSWQEKSVKPVSAGPQAKINRDVSVSKPGPQPKASNLLTK